jgi:hypothetical protein
MMHIMRPFSATRDRVDNAVTSVNDSAREFGGTMKRAADTLALVGVVAVLALGAAIVALFIIVATVGTVGAP